jgi:hypothetical protein
MPDEPPPPPPRLAIADIMILVASLAGLLAVIPGWGGAIRMGAVSSGIQATLTSAAVFLSLGGLGACAARLRGRPRFEGFCWGFICGPCGILTMALATYPPDD